MYSNNPWRKEDWFIQQFIYDGKSLNEMAKEFNVDWSSLVMAITNCPFQKYLVQFAII